MPNKTTRRTSRSVKTRMMMKERQIMMVRKRKMDKQIMLEMTKIRRMVTPSKSAMCSLT